MNDHLDKLMMSVRVRKAVFIFLLLLVLARPVLFVASRWEKYRKPYDFTYYSGKYTNSQYVKGSTFEWLTVGDDIVYAFAGYHYLFQNGDPSNVNFEHPPLGKLLIGVSIFLFNNEFAINLIYFPILLLFVYLISKEITKSLPAALLAVAIVSNDQLFLEQLKVTMLDLPFTVFLLGSMYALIRGIQAMNPIRWYHLHAIFFAAAFSTKFFPLAAILVPVFAGFVYAKKRMWLGAYLISLVWIPVIYVASHYHFFVNHPSLLEFIAVKRYMLSWWRGSPRIPFAIWQNILMGTYYSIEEGVKYYEHWTILLPVVVVCAVLSAFVLRITKSVTGWFLWVLVIIYLIYGTFLTNGIFKYVMAAYPLMAIMAVFLVKELLHAIAKRMPYLLG